MKDFLKPLLFLALLSLIQCKHDPIIPESTNPIVQDTTGNISCNPDSVYFNDDILPIIRATCAQSNCHDQASAKDGVVLIDFNTIRNEIEPGNSSNSDLIDVLTETDPDKLMPRDPITGLGNRMDQAFIDKLIKWIDDGALDSDCKDGCDTTNVTFQNDILPIFSANCAVSGCHNETGRNPKLTNFQNIKNSIDQIEVRAIINKTMPPSGALPDCEITKLKKWIADGAKDN